MKEGGLCFKNISFHFGIRKEFKMSCEYCRTCGEVKYDWKEHNCPPIFYFKHEDWEKSFKK